MTLPSWAVSDALSNVGVVILFVCSGGRLDAHPNENTTIGLTKQLLGKGCRAVIAPPMAFGNVSSPPLASDFSGSMGTRANKS